MRIAPTFLVLLLLASATARPASAQAGTLDPSFGSFGIAQLSVQTDPMLVTRALVQSDGGILLLFGADKMSYVLRLLPTGTLDTGYGNQGVASLSGDNNFALDMALQADGKLLVGGERITRRNRVSVLTGMIWRLNTNGTLDAGWGRKGALPVPLPNNKSPATAIVALLLVQPDGRIDLQLGTDTGDEVERLTADGSLDATFGQGGGVMAFGDDEIVSMALQNDGKILLAAHYFSTGPIMFRLTPTGVIDRSTAYGHIVNSTGANTFQPSGGYITPIQVGDEFALQQINPASMRDTRFASPTIDFGSLPAAHDVSAADCLSAEVNGDVIAAGYWQQDVLSSPPWGGVGRVRDSGRIDQGFGTHGVNKLLVVGYTHFTASAVQPDGKIVVAGAAGADTNNVVAARYFGK